jgi:nucleoside-diphosphate-sugar epimerase
MLTSVVGTHNLLTFAEATGARFFLASTSEIYGDPEVHPQPESYWGNVNPTGPRACYDEGKRAAETLTFDFDRSGRADVRVARIFNTYGRACAPMTAGWSRTSSAKPSPVTTLRFMATEARPAPSATCRTSSMDSCASWLIRGRSPEPSISATRSSSLSAIWQNASLP